MKFIHMADTHLGSKQYHIDERFKDYNRSFKLILKRAINEDVDFILLAGDMFNSSRINPETVTAIYLMISQFKEVCLQKLSRSIPIICIEGNHDKTLYSSSRSWMNFLADLKLIVLLKPTIIDKKIEFPLYSEENNKCGMIKIKDACIFGIPYYGATTKDLFPYIYNSIPEDDNSFNILMMHFGITGQVQDKFGFSIDKSLEDLHEKVDYLALGHFHKMYTLPSENSWIYNPGSIEINDAKEVWGIKGESYERGIFLVEIGGKLGKKNRVKKIHFSNGPSDSNDIPNRFFYQLSIDISLIELSSFKKTVPYVITKLRQTGLPLLQEKDDYKLDDPSIPILLLSLFGTLNYSKLELDISALREKIKNKFKILGLRVFSSTLSSVIDETSAGDRKGRSIDVIERDVFSSIIESNNIYAPHKEKLVTLMSDLKSSLLSSETESKEISINITNWWENNIDTEGSGSISQDNLDNLNNSTGEVEEEQDGEGEEEQDGEGEEEVNITPPVTEEEQNDDNETDLEADLDDLLEGDFDL